MTRTAELKKIATLLISVSAMGALVITPSATAFGIFDWVATTASNWTSGSAWDVVDGSPPQSYPSDSADRAFLLQAANINLDESFTIFGILVTDDIDISGTTTKTLTAQTLNIIAPPTAAISIEVDTAELSIKK